MKELDEMTMMAVEGGKDKSWSAKIRAFLKWVTRYCRHLGPFVHGYYDEL